MLVKSNCRAPFLGLPEGNCDFLKGITLFRYSPFIRLSTSICYFTQVCRLHRGDESGERPFQEL